MITGGLSIHELKELYEFLYNTATKVEEEINKKTEEDKRWLENIQRHRLKQVGSIRVKQ